jgi:iron(III) transport system ATP-binding protein
MQARYGSALLDQLSQPGATSADVKKVPAPPGAMVQLDGVRVAFDRIIAVDDVSLDIREGEVFCLVGPSGSGKSTLLRVIAGLERTGRGRVSIGGTDVDAPGTFVPPERRRVGMVFQDYALFPHLTIAENVAFGLTRRSKPEAAAIVGDLLQRVGLSRYAGSYPHMLSGGERQRVALARALAPSPRILLMDEPFSSLDGLLREQLREATAALLRETGTTAVLVTHEPAEALRLGTRVALMRHGHVVQCDAPDNMYLRPASVFAARFFGEVNEWPGRCVRGTVDTPFGRVASTGFSDAAVHVCVRPQDLQLVGAGDGLPARVVRTSFREGWHDVVADLDWGGTPTKVTIHSRSLTPPAVGETIAIHADAARVIIAAADAAAPFHS